MSRRIHPAALRALRHAVLLGEADPDPRSACALVRAGLAEWTGEPERFPFTVRPTLRGRSLVDQLEELV